MAENLNYDTRKGSWCLGNISDYCNIYGKMYDWETALNVCPDGWHLPSKEEWEELREFLGGNKIAGGKMKEVGTKYWARPNRGATNESGFSSLPGGFMDVYYMKWYNRSFTVRFWSTSYSGKKVKWPYYFQLNNGNTKAYISTTMDYNAHYIRCIKNE
jgi:uncharacterized protein (TIGR02145 family)